ncbi:MAG: helix-turn-helix domain-containing protein [Nitrospiria bacterium]
MPKHYDHLTLSERDKITAMLYEHHSLTQIGLALGRSKSTISREIKRNASPEYKCYLSHRPHSRSEQRNPV